MEERKFIRLKKEEFGIKEAIKRNLGKGKISRLDIEYTPVGEKIIISTNKPGLVIGRKGEKIHELTNILKMRFKLENPHIEINEIKNPLFDAQLVADDIAMALERMGNLKFKVIAYRKLQEIMNAGALGCEMRLSGKLPSERAKSWRFAEGYLKKSGESRKEIDRAQAVGLTKTGIIGVKVAIMNPDAKIYDRIDIDEKLKAMINSSGDVEDVEKKEVKKSKKVKKVKVKDEVEVGDKEEVKNEEGSSFVEDKMETKNLDLKPEEEGTAMKIEEEIEDGVPQDVIDAEIKEEIEEHEEKVEGVGEKVEGDEGIGGKGGEEVEGDEGKDNKGEKPSEDKK